MAKFHLIPYAQLSIKSKLSKNELIAKLKNQISNRNIFKEIIKPTKTSFNGFINVESGQFRLNPKIKYRNTSNPEVTGSIKETKSGSEISVKINLPVLSYIALFVVFITASTVVYFSPTLTNLISSIGIMLFTYLLTIFDFNMGVGETKDAFQKLVREKRKQKSKRQP